jgi:hypothetical protein
MKTMENALIINRFSFYIAITTAVMTFITFVIAVLTPPLSGPFCEGPCLEYPYTAAVSRFPRDYYWMYPAMLVELLYVILMVCIHCYANPGRRIFSHIGLSLALIAAMILIANYFVQVSVVQPSLIKGETDGIAILSQYNPHGLFIALEEIGYLLMTVSFMSVAPVFPSVNRLHKTLRVTLVSGFLLAVVALALVSVRYGIMREYIFEVIIISIVWVELIFTSLLLTRIFKKEMGISKT